MDTVIYYEKYRIRQTSLYLSVTRAMAPSTWWGVTAWKILLRGWMMRGRRKKSFSRRRRMTRLVPKYRRLGTKTEMNKCTISVPVHVLCTLNKVSKKLEDKHKQYDILGDNFSRFSILGFIFLKQLRYAALGRFFSSHCI